MSKGKYGETCTAKEMVEILNNGEKVIVYGDPIYFDKSRVPSDPHTYYRKKIAAGDIAVNVEKQSIKRENPYRDMEVKDLNFHRTSRLNSDVIKAWKKVKQQTLENVIFGHGRDYLPKEMLEILDANPEAVEIAVDTVIGWLNTYCGRIFLKEAFGVNIPQTDPKGTE